MSWIESEDYRFVLDSGAWNFRLAKLESESQPTIYKAIGRVGTEKKTNRNFVIESSEEFINESENRFTNTHTKGVLTNYLAYNDLFDAAMNRFDLINEKRSLKTYSLTLNVLPFQPKRAACNQLEYLMELEGFGAIWPIRPGEKLFGENSRHSGLLVDIGHSHTHVIPVFNDSVVMQAVRRLEIGGKLLTKAFAEVISTTQVNLRNYFFTVNSIKEKMSMICPIGKAKEWLCNSNRTALEKTYLLPDYEINLKGELFTGIGRPEKEHIRLTNERFTIPEALFTPGMLNN